MTDVRAWRAAVAAAAAVVLGVVAVLALQPGGAQAALVVDDAAQLLAAATAAVVCAARARRCAGRLRPSWAMVALGAASWATGQGIWTYDQLVLGEAVPFPSPADAALLLFPALALPALLLRPSTSARRSGARYLLDGAMVAASVLVASWVTALGAAWAAGAQDRFALAVSLAYPVADIVMVSVVVMTMTYARSRTPLTVLAAGLVAMAVADGAFSYLTAAGAYQSASVTDAGWVAAFLLIALAALHPQDEAVPVAVEHLPTAHVALPFVLVGVGAVALGLARAAGHRSEAALGVEAVAVAALLLRQLLTAVENRRLVVRLSEQRAALHRQAHTDDLTGLGNRALLHQRAGAAVADARAAGGATAVLLCDLDDFKAVNDTLGHDAGDALLRAVAGRLRAAAGPGAAVARMGGDEFAVLLPAAPDARDAESGAAAAAAAVLAAMLPPVALGPRQLPVRMSVGSAVLAGPGTALDLLKRADVALYAAKDGGGAAVVAHTEALSVLAADDLDLQLALRRAVAEGELRAAFQPIVDVDGRVVAVEALARWTHRGRPVPPDVFIPLAKRAHVLAELDLLVVEQALAHVARSSPVGGPPLRASVNLGLAHSAHTDLPARLAAALQRHGLTGDRVMVEVLEHEALSDADATTTLQALRGLGMTVAVDDFGVGHSNLSRLAVLKPDVVKVDRSFITPLPGDADALRLVASVVDLAHAVGAAVVAEGVETEAQREALLAVGCDALQGHLIARPAVPEELLDDGGAPGGRRSGAGAATGA